MARLTGNGAYLHAGPEYAVASTKVFTNMVAVGLLFALTISNISPQERKDIIKDLRKLPNIVSSQLLDEDNSISEATEWIVNSNLQFS